MGQVLGGVTDMCGVGRQDLVTCARLCSTVTNSDLSPAIFSSSSSNPTKSKAHEASDSI